MSSVNVDLDDLETIIFAAAAIKNIESALAARKVDPFVQPHLDCTAAVDRLVSAMRNAKRELASGDTLVAYNEPLTKEEANALRYVAKASEERKPGISVFVISPEDKGEPGVAMSVYDRLAAKGCLEMGQFVQGIVWAGAPTPQITADPKGYAARLTQRGREKLKLTPGTAHEPS